MRYFLYKDSHVLGPMEREELMQIPDLGPGSLVCAEDAAGGGETQWINLSDVSDLADLARHDPRLPGTALAVHDIPIELGPETEYESRETWETVLDYAAKGLGAGEFEGRRKYVDELERKLEGLKDQLGKYEQQQNDILDHLNQKEKIISKYEDQQSEIVRQLNEKAKLLEEKEKLLLQMQVQMQPSPAATPPELEALKEKVDRYEEQQKQMLQQIQQKNRFIEEKELLEKLKAEIQATLPAPQPAPAGPNLEMERLKDRIARFEEQQVQLRRQLEEKRWNIDDDEIEKLKAQMQQVLLLSSASTAEAVPHPPIASEFESLKEKLSQYEEQQRVIMRQLEQRSRAASPMFLEMQAMKDKLRQYEEQQRQIQREIEQKNRLLEEKELIERLKSHIPQPPAYPPPTSAPAPALQVEELKGILGRYEQQQKIFFDLISQKDRLIEQRDNLLAKLESKLEKLQAPPPVPQETTETTPSPQYEAFKERLSQYEHQQKELLQAHLLQKDALTRLTQKDRNLVEQGNELLDKFKVHLQEAVENLSRSSQPTVDLGVMTELRDRLFRYEQRQEALIEQLRDQPKTAAPAAEIPPAIAERMAELERKAQVYEQENNRMRREIDEKNRLIVEEKGLLDKIKNEPKPAPAPEVLPQPAQATVQKLEALESALQFPPAVEPPQTLRDPPPPPIEPAPMMEVPPAGAPAPLIFEAPIPEMRPQEPLAQVLANPPEPVSMVPPSEPAPVLPKEPTQSEMSTEMLRDRSSESMVGRVFIPPAPTPLRPVPPQIELSPEPAPSAAFPPAPMDLPNIGIQEGPVPAPEPMTFAPPKEAPVFGGGIPQEPMSSIPNTMVFGSPQEQYSIPLDNPTAMGPGAPVPLYPPTPAPQQPMGLRPNPAGRDEVEASKPVKKRSVLLPMVVGGICVAGLLLFALSSNDSKRLFSGNKSLPKPAPAPIQTQTLNTAPERPASQMPPQQPAPQESALAPEPAAVPAADTTSGRDHIADVSQQALKLVKKYKLNGRRGDIAHWLEYSFVTPGSEPEWSANATSADTYYVEFRVKSSRGGADDPAARYIFEANLDKKTVVGINPNAKELFTGGSAGRSLRAGPATRGAAKKSKRRKSSNAVPLMPLPSESAVSKLRKRRPSKPLPAETETPAFVMEGGDSTFNNPAAP